VILLQIISDSVVNHSI